MRRVIMGIGASVIVTSALWFYTKQKQVPRAAPEKVLVTVSNAQIKGLDPIQGTDVYIVREIAKVCEGLLEYHYLKRPYELVPNLAAAMPTVSDDQLVYTFKLLEGVKFHDNPCFPDGQGRELTAQDFVYTFKRLADPKNQAQNFWLIDEKIQGLNEWREKYIDAPAADYVENISGLQAIDRYTIQFRLTKPDPRFLHILAMAPSYVVAQEAVEHYGAEFVNHPVGTGPFTLEAFHPQEAKIIYHKNPNFRDKHFPSEAADEYKHMIAYAGKKLPLVDKIVTHILPEEQPRWLKFRKGQIDILDISGDNIAIEIIDNGVLIPAIRESGIALFTVPAVSTGYFVINNANPLFNNNKKLRQAMSMAFDRDRYNQLFHKGTAALAQSTVPPGLAGYQANYVNPYCVYDIERAKQYLAEAGYPDGQGLPIITLDTVANTNQKQRAEFFQQCMKAIGINISIETNTWPELIRKKQKKATMLHAIAWNADYPDAESFFQLFYAPSQPTGLGMHFNDDAFNILYEKAIAMPDSPERTALYEQLNQLVGESVPMIYMVHTLHFFLHQSWVKNYCWSDFHYGTEQYCDVDRSKR
ncbi:MAG: ABC transporter substrate-binding protein [Bacteroidota bacterium]